VRGGDSVVTGQISKGHKDEGDDATRWATGKAVNRKQDRKGKQERELERELEFAHMLHAEMTQILVFVVHQQNQGRVENPIDSFPSPVEDERIQSEYNNQLSE